jgi:hypothetical protein
MRRIVSALKRLGRQDGGVLEPRVARGSSGVCGNELRVDRVAQEHLDMVQGFEQRRGDASVPDVELEREVVIVVGFCQVWCEPCVGQPSGGLGRRDVRWSIACHGDKLRGVCPR